MQFIEYSVIPSDPLCVGFNMRPSEKTKNNPDATKRTIPNDFYALRVYECMKATLDGKEIWVPNKNSEMPCNSKKFDGDARYGNKILERYHLIRENVVRKCKRNDDSVLDDLGHGLAESIRSWRICEQVDELIRGRSTEVIFKDALDKALDRVMGEKTNGKIVTSYHSNWDVKKLQNQDSNLAPFQNAATFKKNPDTWKRYIDIPFFPYD